ncbi:hypothetical protein B296_00057041 [Ensete ventricosum]|uniref:Uncharacterized protein n=1 Tax=Ensete ventricosum TaxID=4639 RepID=A0A426X2Q9_ENSVE|nr:hypothetical protein B296_00057041 [Ensete ventricosum]
MMGGNTGKRSFMRVGQVLDDRAHDYTLGSDGTGLSEARHEAAAEVERHEPLEAADGSAADEERGQSRWPRLPAPRSPSKPPTAAPPMKSAGRAAGPASPSSSTITVACAPTTASSRRITSQVQHPRRVNTTTGLSLIIRFILSSGASSPSIVNAPCIELDGSRYLMKRDERLVAFISSETKEAAII